MKLRFFQVMTLGALTGFFTVLFASVEIRLKPDNKETSQSEVTCSRHSSNA